jgi:hypothetical protein
MMTMTLYMQIWELCLKMYHQGQEVGAIINQANRKTIQQQSFVHAIYNQTGNLSSSL